MPVEPTDDSITRLSVTDTQPATAEQEAALVVPALSVLYHPRLQRVGERALLRELLGGSHAALSRREPLFTAPGTARETPLEDRRLSRRGLRLSGAVDGAVCLDVDASPIRVSAAGVPLTASRTFSAAELDNGVVLTLERRVVLLLHRYRVFPAAPPPRFGLVGDSSALVRLRMDVERVADLNVLVLLRGETGTGKELVASAIHSASRRRGDFLAVNLGAIPASLASSELFGASKGAFTGAVRAQPGYFARAAGGTLFLDEIGEAPAEVQVQLLRVLESGEIQTVGGQKPRPVDARLIAATDADLERQISAGTFRAPLFHRLAGYEILLPPLRARRDDVGRLVRHFLERELEAIGEARRLAAEDATRWLPPQLFAQLAAYDWPGNVRQLRNVVRQLVIGSRGLPALAIGPAVERLLQTTDCEPPPSVVSPPAEVEAPLTAPRRKPATVGEEELIEVLRTHRWNLKATAEALRISRTSLYLLIDKFPTVRAPGDISNQEIRRTWEECNGDLEVATEKLEISRRALRRRLRELGLR